MKILDNKSTEIFCKLVDSLDQKGHRKIKNEPFLPLTIERIWQGVETPFGVGDQYSLCHSYMQNHDVMVDPEMCFVLVDKRYGRNDAFDLVAVIPYMYQLAALAIYQASISFTDDKAALEDSEQQKDHCDFAEMWLRNIEAQGFLELMGGEEE